MSTLHWPSRFPLPSLNRFTTRPGNALLRTEMEAGPARQRRQFTQNPAQIDVEWRVDRVTFGMIESWFRHYLHDGANWFLIKLWSGNAMEDHRVRFTAPYTAQPLSNALIIINAELEVDNPPIVSKTALDNYLR